MSYECWKREEGEGRETLAWHIQSQISGSSIVLPQILPLLLTGYGTNVSWGKGKCLENDCIA